MKKYVLIFLLLLSACSNNKEETKTVNPEETSINWFAGVGQFNGSLDFGNLTTAANKMLTITIKNVGDSSLIGPAVISGNNFDLVYQNCELLSVGRSCTAKISFSSINKDNGTYEGTLRLGDQVAQIRAAVNVVSVTELEFSVNGIPLENNLIDFGIIKYNQSVNNSVSLKVKHDTAKNSINNVRLSATNSDFNINYDSCSNKVLKDGFSCSVKVSVGGAGKSGVIEDSLIIGDSVLNLKVEVKNLETVAQEESLIKLVVNNQSFNPGPVNLGTLNFKKIKMLNMYLKNEGTATGIIQEMVFPEELQVMSSNCPEGQLLKAKSSCLIKLFANPQVKGATSSQATIQGNSYLLQSVVREPGDKIYCSVDNAEQSFITWDGSLYSNCMVESCLPTHHLINNTCESNVISCSIDNGRGYRNWENNQYGACLVSSCDDNYHSEAGLCLSNTKTCSIVDGQGNQTWNGFDYSNCLVSTCNTDFHKEGNLCVSDTQNCDVDNGSGTKLWNGSSYGICRANNCITNYHVSNSQCVANSQGCNITDGTGSQTWTGTDWGTCQLVDCNTNFHKEGNSCVANTQVCNEGNGSGTKLWNGTTYNSCQLSSCNTGYALYGNSCLVASTQWRVRHVTVQQGHTPRTATWQFSDPSGQLSYTALSSQTMDNNAINNSTNQPWGFANNCSDQGAILGLSTPNSYTLNIQFSSPKHVSQVRAYSVYVGGSRAANLAIEYFNGTAWVTAKSWDMSAPSGCGWMDTGSFSSNY